MQSVARQPTTLLVWPGCETKEVIRLRLRGRKPRRASRRHNGVGSDVSGSACRLGKELGDRDSWEKREKGLWIETGRDGAVWWHRDNEKGIIELEFFHRLCCAGRYMYVFVWVFLRLSARFPWPTRQSNIRLLWPLQNLLTNLIICPPQNEQQVAKCSRTFCWSKVFFYIILVVVDVVAVFLRAF